MKLNMQVTLVEVTFIVIVNIGATVNIIDIGVNPYIRDRGIHKKQFQYSDV